MMGLHTWFKKDKALYELEKKLWAKVDAHDEGEICLNELELDSAFKEACRVSDSNEARYHDVFRTGKRNEDGTYTDDVIYSKEECSEWLKNNDHSNLNEELLEQFWEEYSNGVIEFG